MELKSQHPFVLRNQHFRVAAAALPDAGEPLRNTNHVVGVKLVYLKLGFPCTVKFSEVAYIVILVRHNRNILESPSLLSFLNSSAMDVGKKLMSEAETDDFQSFVQI